MPVPLGQPFAMVPVPQRQPCEPQFLDVEGLPPQHLILQVRMNRSAQPLPSGSRTKAGLETMPGKADEVTDCIATVDDKVLA
jgi:hypothetical protein